MSNQEFACDVLVVGLGPVGATLAAFLAQNGVSTIAVDHETATYPLPRAVHFDHEIMRIFQALGIGEAIQRHARVSPAYEFRTADGQLLLRLDPSAETSSGWASGYMFYQPGLESALRTHLAALSVARVLLGWRFEKLTQDAEAVTATMTGPEGRAVVRARYLVGCDGASSSVRAMIGSGLQDFHFNEPWLVVDTKTQADAGRRRRTRSQSSDL